MSTMANSPLLVPGPTDKATTSKSKLSSAAPSSNGVTPEASTKTSNALAPVQDIAEQMNEEEKHKYVKGMSMPN